MEGFGKSSFSGLTPFHLAKPIRPEDARPVLFQYSNRHALFLSTSFLPFDRFQYRFNHRSKLRFQPPAKLCPNNASTPLRAAIEPSPPPSLLTPDPASLRTLILTSFKPSLRTLPRTTIAANITSPIVSIFAPHFPSCIASDTAPSLASNIASNVFPGVASNIAANVVLTIALSQFTFARSRLNSAYSAYAAQIRPRSRPRTSQRKRRRIPSEVFRPTQNQGHVAHANSGACSPRKLRGIQPTQIQARSQWTARHAGPCTENYKALGEARSQ